MIKRIKDVKKAEKILQKCERCCHGHDKGQTRNKTYKSIRMKYVSLFWGEK